jgi:hypothetical protein
MKAISKIIATICLATFSLSVNAQEVEKPTLKEPVKIAPVVQTIPAQRNTKRTSEKVIYQRQEKKLISPEKHTIKAEPIKE